MTSKRHKASDEKVILTKVKVVTCPVPLGFPTKDDTQEVENHKFQIYCDP